MAKKSKKRGAVSKPTVSKSVSSKIEHTKEETPKETKHSVSAVEYRKSIEEMAGEVKKFAVKLCPNNLLSVKIALMGAVRDVEKMMKERKSER